ncbi:MAG: HAD family hydrolase [Treponema sp.]|nr:HAD family hydrolase [Treponema sp.]
MQIISFDLGWTIEDETDAQMQRCNDTVKILNKYGYQILTEDILNKQDELGAFGCGAVFRDSLTALGVSTEVKNIIRNEVIWNPVLCKKYDGIEKVLIKIKNGGNKVAMIANQSKPVIERLKKYDIYQYFDDIICSCDVGCEKPDEKIFMILMDKYGNDNDYWMVGDRVDNDIIPAKKLGWKTIRLLKGPHRNYSEKNKNETADYTVKDIDEISRIQELNV